MNNSRNHSPLASHTQVMEMVTQWVIGVTYKITACLSNHICVDPRGTGVAQPPSWETYNLPLRYVTDQLELLFLVTGAMYFSLASRVTRAGGVTAFNFGVQLRNLCSRTPGS